MTLWPEISWFERDIDLLVLQELAVSKSFAEEFQRTIGRTPEQVASLRHSVLERFGGLAWGETDIFVSLADGSHLLIENKLTASFGPDQALRYRARAQHHCCNGLPATTVLIAPAGYAAQVDAREWDAVVTYEQLADALPSDDPRAHFHAEVLRRANTRASRLRALSKDKAAQRAAGPELLAFKTAWFEMLKLDSVWTANAQKGANDEFLYRRRVNPFRLTIWHHPMAGYLSVQVPPDLAQIVRARLPAELPDGMSLRHHPSTIYVDVATSPIDMSSQFHDEIALISDALERAGRALNIVEDCLHCV